MTRSLIDPGSVLLASANVSVGLFRHTTELARLNLLEAGADGFDVQTRIVSSVVRAIDNW